MNLSDCENADDQNDRRNSTHGRDKDSPIRLHHPGGGPRLISIPSDRARAMNLCVILTESGTAIVLRQA